ncbi:type II toxin-antitoxin system ParD family antitoxin [Denitrobaculum tricleocarpae]|uniref:Type II toxin-antitoxin system ParD family antitoxin n=1 Tax=Denitrobaculum tricleocarpae TaxID=2591009 RepID=A0A545SYM4_9PROT|nr:type II toxin-antitoxin system ParD family antitoxin [Denitrobaculum tricleocarpae]TQV70062.1 type II toxin-antitoxin system ParD family antitoxin [Denitrobaculum tricleocarpae]
MIDFGLTERFDSFLTRQIEGGRFKNASEVVRAALHLLERQEREEEAKLEALRRDAKTGANAYERGDYTPIADDLALDTFFGDVAEEADKR